ncbi:MAG: DUF4199 domain-containing protein [Prevotellaceae bacterium]|jgi:hypothetical protein|nr:DUF4199 domain-containing protein [Prevotellaceae bacterium]
MPPNIIKSAMSCGLILGLLFSVNFLLNVSGNAVLSLLGYAVTIIIVIATYKMAIRFRNSDCGGYISYGKSFSLILLMFFFGAIVSALTKYIYCQFINPEYLENLLEQSMKIFESMQFPLTDEIYDNMQTLLNPFSFTMQYIWVNVFLGAFTGVFMSFFIKKEKGLFD